MAEAPPGGLVRPARLERPSNRISSAADDAIADRSDAHRHPAVLHALLSHATIRHYAPSDYVAPTKLPFLSNNPHVAAARLTLRPVTVRGPR